MTGQERREVLAEVCLCNRDPLPGEPHSPTCTYARVTRQEEHVERLHTSEPSP